jgi:hypothetical protein
MRRICEVAAEIINVWEKPYFGAVPYLQAMLCLVDKNDKYGLDSAESIVQYFLGNANTFRGEDARRLKLELKELIK